MNNSRMKKESVVDVITVERFAQDMRERMAVKHREGMSGWEKLDCSSANLATALLARLKGNYGPSTYVDIANYAMMLHMRNAPPGVLKTALYELYADTKLEEKVVQAAAVPSTWKLVPLNPTKAMLEVGINCEKLNMSVGVVDRLWNLMVNAAPESAIKQNESTQPTRPTGYSNWYLRSFGDESNALLSLQKYVQAACTWLENVYCRYKEQEDTDTAFLINWMYDNWPRESAIDHEAAARKHLDDSEKLTGVYAVTTPIDMILHCPKCFVQHIDAPEDCVDKECPHYGTTHEHTNGWTNPPHRSHKCLACGYIWRPADVPTNGVAEIKTKGNDDHIFKGRVTKEQAMMRFEHWLYGGESPFSGVLSSRELHMLKTTWLAALNTER